MADTRTSTPSIADRARRVAAGAPIVAAHCLGDTAVFVLGEEALLAVDRSGASRRIAVHGGAILASTATADAILTGGDDGKVMATRLDGAPEAVASDAKRRWINHVAVGGSGSFAWAAGKEAFALSPKSDVRTLDLPSTAGGLAFAPKGVRLAVSHYNGATLWFPNAQGDPQRLEWKGSHLDVAFSPDGRFLVTAMQEATLHGWRIEDGKHMRMSGYATKVRSMRVTADGKALATSGANQLILWPFAAKDGPMGKAPTMLAPSEGNVTCVRCHPRQPVAAVGYEDGLVLLVRLDDGAEVLAKRPGDAPVSALAWNATGTILAVGCEDGEASVIALG